MPLDSIPCLGTEGPWHGHGVHDFLGESVALSAAGPSKVSAVLALELKTLQG